MKTFLNFLIPIILIGIIIWLVKERFSPKTTTESKHQILVERIESMGKLELVKYRFSDVVEHKDISTYLPDASVLLIVKADAVGCIDLSKVTAEDVSISGDSATIVLPKAELCYVKIDHKASKVYDTKMAFFREATLVDEAFKSAEAEITKQVQKSDILAQTQSNAIHVFQPLLEGLGFKKVNLTFR